VASGPLLAKFYTLTQSSCYATDYLHLYKIIMQKGGNFQMSSENISFLMKKVDM